MSLEIQNISIRSGDFRLSDISLSIVKGQIASVMGKSGIGKTTLVEALCGLRPIESGVVFLGNRRVDQLQPGERGISLVPQDAVLFPHMTVYEHLEFALKLHHWAKVDRKERVERLALSLGVEHLLSRKPRGLSGGESKRVAIGRAIAAVPRLLCLDEAFTGLDDDTSHSVMTRLKDATADESITIINVTHRVEEAKSMGGAVYRLDKNGLHSLTEVADEV